jgi:FtsP/CotA-like multicopper oxidase with cupredoxin domain
MLAMLFRGWFLLSVILAIQHSAAATRHYFIAAEDVSWDYAPSKRDLIHGAHIPMPWEQQTQWPKTRFIEYTDNSFSVHKPQPEWLGILGPVIRAEVGDTVVVEFLNRSLRIHNIHPHGLRYDKSNEGAQYVAAGPGSQILSGARYTYTWIADAGSGPGPADPSSIVWWYHPHSDEPSETNAGLMGPIVITAKGKARPDGSPKDVDQEFVTSFMIFDELMAKFESQTHGMNRTFKRDPNDDMGRFYAINGYVFGNLPGLTVKSGSRVRWYLMGMGGEQDLHTPHWHGKTVQYQNRHADVIELLPASTATVDMLADNPGTWLFHCQVTDHMEAGMMATYTIYPPAANSCPIRFSEGDFWNNPKELSVSVRNTSKKTIASMVLTPGAFLSRMDLRTSLTPWISNDPIAPGAQRTLKSKNFYQSGGIVGWALFPYQIVYADGSKWAPQQHGECFGVYWRDKEQPPVQVLPPFQMETNSD